MAKESLPRGATVRRVGIAASAVAAPVIVAGVGEHILGGISGHPLRDLVVGGVALAGGAIGARHLTRDQTTSTGLVKRTTTRRDGLRE